ncbi:RagB/SusD family nutrient uptake outer membrane protein [Niabella pedocola]|uniref:RagB/SusD family nutrient uptake outer membrane protein n=1 Tax=Niabella pedocola TaxID=1752077 RepID=A0ABS8PXC6_9BACT|nr:RagB/SusD family nutrient uptake outer membrane protein [Niabella pedocola]MCD2425733.1 RagB/SusD family nutrient uptake outer membrane protein [Niabella pedocola]
MIRNISILLIFFTLFAASSCKKEFLDTFPTGSVSDADAVKSTDNAWAALNGIHRALTAQYDAQPQGGEAGAMSIRDVMGEDLIYTIASGRLDFSTVLRWLGHRNIADAQVKFIYRYYYRIISNANILISGIDQATGPEADKKFIKGQALAYRAWAHFNLVQLWAERYDAAGANDGLGIPLLTVNTLEGQPRATVKAVYDQINKDLDDAIVLLDGYSRSGSAAKSNINRSVAYGFKARVALTQQNWDVAATNAAQARAGLSLMSNTDYLSGFNDINNTEWMWGSRIITETTPFFYQFHAFMATNYNSSAVKTQPKAINSSLWEALSVTDVRKKCWIKAGSAATVQAGIPWNSGSAGTGYSYIPYHMKKFWISNLSGSIGDVPMMRVGEMYLIEAEARARQGGHDVEARTALFDLMSNRDPGYILSIKSGQALIDEIMLHRRVELWGEGFRFTDLKRTNSALNRTIAPNTNTAISVTMEVPAGDKLWVWLFPQDEINNNPAIVQNPL